MNQGITCMEKGGADRKEETGATSNNALIVYRSPLFSCETPVDFLQKTPNPVLNSSQRPEMYIIVDSTK